MSATPYIAITAPNAFVRLPSDMRSALYDKAILVEVKPWAKTVAGYTYRRDEPKERYRRIITTGQTWHPKDRRRNGLRPNVSERRPRMGYMKKATRLEREGAIQCVCDGGGGEKEKGREGEREKEG